MAKKTFKAVDLKVYAVSDEPDCQAIAAESIPPKVTSVAFPAEKNATDVRSHDFATYYGKGCDDVMFAMQRTIEHLVNESIQSNKLAISSIVTCCSVGVSNFALFSRLIVAALGRDLMLADINQDLIKRYIAYLAETFKSLGSQRIIYSQTKSVLVAMAKSGWLGQAQRHIFPKNPYPNLRRSSKGQKPLSQPEVSRLSQALAKELQRIKKASEPLNSYDAVVCMLAICVRTGINPTPLLELSSDCLQSHPLKSDRRLLVSFKRRGSATHITSIRKSEELALFNTVMMDVAAIIDLVVERNKHVRQALGSSRLWVVVAEGNNYGGQNIIASKSALFRNINAFVRRNQLCDDDQKALKLNASRLRKSFINRIWLLSGQDPIVTAAMGNHSLTVSNDHYLEAPPEAEKNFSLLGEIRVKELLGQASVIPADNTPVAKCKDSLYGHRAPKNGQHCTDFLACFRCKSFVVTGDDLYRVFSLYWLLVVERNTVGAKRWSRFYAHIIRIIDNDIAPQFDTATIAVAKAKAKDIPHPYWKTFEELEGLVT